MNTKNYLLLNAIDPSDLKAKDYGEMCEILKVVNATILRADLGAYSRYFLSAPDLETLEDVCTHYGLAGPAVEYTQEYTQTMRYELIVMGDSTES